MTPQQARDYLIAAAKTETGKQAMRATGFAQIITQPDKGDDKSSLIAARRVREKLAQSYPAL